MVMITIVLAALVLLVALQLPGLWYDPTVPTVFEITKIKDIKNGVLNYDSYMVVKNSGSSSYYNWNLFVLTYVNGAQIPAEIPTLNANAQAADHIHHGVQNLGGFGSEGTRKKGDALWVRERPFRSITRMAHSIRATWSPSKSTTTRQNRSSRATPGRIKTIPGRN